MKNTFLLLAFILPATLLAQHTIKGTFSPAEDYKFALLYEVKPTGAFFEADTRFINGSFTITMKDNAKPGIYKLVYAFPQEENSLELIYNGKEDIAFTFSKEQGVSFSSSEENKAWQNHLRGFNQLQNEIAAAYQDPKLDKKLLSEKFEALQKLHNENEANSEGMLANSFIKSYRFYVPSAFEDVSSYQKNLLDNYLVNVNYKDKNLQGTKFLQDLTYGYITIMQDYKMSLDNVAQKISPAGIEFKKSFLYELWITLTQDPAIQKANYLATKHLIPTAKEAKDTAMVNRVFTFTSLTLGSKAPNFSWEEDGKTKWLHKVAPAENYVLVFWSSGCSHCVAEVPQVHAAVEKLDPAFVKVVAIGLEDEPYDWKNMTQDFPRFINVLGLGKWENDIGKTYNVEGTPTYIVLDKDKKIKAKPESLEELMGLLNIE
ncbi:TlpA family protein disulfide reductase [Patiriisocius hiemis]|uniref:Thioredoxin family protein n=1 Tax=Patiriisocius hiemis TaxID=3075604 RepID=A0ABU2YB10_9FLAO|nr:thioredoxin family protein [Constantimarinum sp. W242]MDT0555381.1 thioredoxin family protein [Constantimarinum sp. W242]